MSRYGKSRGENGAPPPRPTRTRAPDFLRYERGEIEALNKLNFPLAGWVYFILLQHCVFDTGEFLGSYARLQELCTEPKPEKGPRDKGPTRDQVRRAVYALEHTGLLVRGEQNAAQGQLRLFIAPRRRSRA